MSPAQAAKGRAGAAAGRLRGIYFFSESMPASPRPASAAGDVLRSTRPTWPCAPSVTAWSGGWRSPLRAGGALLAQPGIRRPGGRSRQPPATRGCSPARCRGCAASWPASPPPSRMRCCWARCRLPRTAWAQLAVSPDAGALGVLFFATRFFARRDAAGQWREVIFLASQAWPACRRSQPQPGARAQWVAAVPSFEPRDMNPKAATPGWWGARCSMAA